MDKARRDKLIIGGKAGKLDAREQEELACDFEACVETLEYMKRKLHGIVAQTQARCASF